MIIAYTITSNLGPITKNGVLLKSFLLCLVFYHLYSSGLTGKSDEDTGVSVVTLTIEAALAGLWESTIFRIAMANLGVDKQQLGKRSLFLISSVAGHVMLPRLCQLIGLPSFITGKLTDDLSDMIPAFHVIAMFKYSIVNEILLYYFPTVFSRQAIIHTPGKYVIVACAGRPTLPTKPRSQHPLNWAHYLIFGSLLFVALDNRNAPVRIVKGLLHRPVGTIKAGIASLTGDYTAVFREQRILARAIRLALRGDTHKLYDIFNVSFKEALWYMMSRFGVIFVLFNARCFYHIFAWNIRRLAIAIGLSE